MIRTNKRNAKKRILRKLISLGSVTLLMLVIICYGVSVRAGRALSLEVTVKPGDTLWAIAEKHSSGKEDIREFIYQIKRLNGLPTSALSPGQVIRVPLR